MTTIVVALAAEARPIVRHFGLRPTASQPFRVYQGEAVRLIVSGVGSAASAAAVDHLGGGRGRRPRAWINVGIAGHRDAALGGLRLASRIVDRKSGRAWYPPAVFDPPCAGAQVTTVDDVERELTGDFLYEMEAAGFYPAALRFATAELVQVLKVVSDNRVERAERLTAARVGELIAQGLPVVEKVVRELTAIATALGERVGSPERLNEYVGRWHFTVTQERQLERLLRRLGALGRRIEPTFFDDATSAAAVLGGLRQLI